VADVTGQIQNRSTDRVSFETASDPRGSRVFIGAPDYRVFVWGVEITQDVLSIQVSNQIDENLSTATVTLANDNEKWVVPNALNLVSVDVLPDELTLPSGDNALSTMSPTGTNTQELRVGMVTPISFAKKKRENFLTAITGGAASASDASLALVKQFSNSKNFPFIPGRPMIQMGDPIRIFLKNPWAIARSDVNLQGPTTTGEVVSGPPGSQEEWYFAFTGYIGVATEAVEAETNKSNIVLACEDIRRLLRYMRTTTSPNVFNFNAFPSIPDASAKDLLKRVAGDSILVSGNQAMQAGMRLVNTGADDQPGLVDFLLFGDTNLEAQGFIAQQQQNGLQVGGLLGFNRNSRTVLLLNGNSGPDIEQQVSDVMDRIYPKLTESDVDRYGADWSLGANPATAPEPNHLYVILPDKTGFAPAGTDGSADFFWPYDFLMRIDYFTEFRSRLDIINEFVKNIDSTWYTTPKGDIVVEFPLYDALPFNFNTPWKQTLQLHDEYERFASSEDDRLIKTLTIAQASPVPGLNSTGFPPINIGRHFNPELAARFGIREQRDSRPFKYSEDNAASSANTLAALWQNLANADAYRLEGLEMTPNFRAPIARPYFFEHRNIIGFARGIHHQISWATLCKTVYDLVYMRQFDPGVGTWTKLGGGFGWNWINSPGVGGDDDVIGSVGPRRLITSQKTSDPMADQIDQFLQTIGPREEATVSNQDLTRLRQISQDLRGETDPTRQQALSDEASGIIGKIRY
jgi:hypothetical protein